VDASPCKFVHDFPQKPDKDEAKSLLSRAKPALRVFLDARFRDGFREDVREGCLLGKGEGSLDSYGVSYGVEFILVGLPLMLASGDRSSRPVMNRFVLGRRAVVAARELD